MTNKSQNPKSKHLENLLSLRYNSGLFAASAKNVTTGYDKAWLRDNFYVALGLYEAGEKERALEVVRALLAILHKHRFKIEHAVLDKPQFSFQYIHARFHPETFDEFWESWGNKQNDAVGALLFLFGILMHDALLQPTENEKAIIQKLVSYLGSIEYWHDYDSGIWEEWEEVHASSVGACVAGLHAVQKAGFDVPDELIQHGSDALAELLPRESKDKFCDLALLTLVYPYNILSEEQANEVLANVEYHLVKNRGVIRYKTDHYYNRNQDTWSEEAEWTFGFPFLALAYKQLNNNGKANFYLKKAQHTITPAGTVPELYYSQTDKPNENNPLAWSEAMMLIALTKLSYHE